MIADCVGLNRSLHDAELSGAELPLIERGAELRGELAGGGVTDAMSAGARSSWCRAAPNSGNPAP